jgi:hypothetical protein
MASGAPSPANERNGAANVVTAANTAALPQIASRREKLCVTGFLRGMPSPRYGRGLGNAIYLLLG